MFKRFKKFTSLLLIAAILTAFTFAPIVTHEAQAANTVYYSKTALTGGTATALDYIDGNLLVDGDIAHVFVSGAYYVYKLNASSSAVEAVPTVIVPDTNPGTKRWELQAAMKGIGAANQKMFTNAAGTAPEWAKGICIHNGTRSADAASGDVSYTGFGFKPSAIIIIAVYNGNWAVSIGFDDGTTHFCVYNNAANFPNTWSVATSYSLVITPEASHAQQMVVKTMDADGFTATWTGTGDYPGLVSFSVIAFR